MPFSNGNDAVLMWYHIPRSVSLSRRDEPTEKALTCVTGRAERAILLTDLRENILRMMMRVLVVVWYYEMSCKCRAETENANGQMSAKQLQTE
jgi:hypothetical protein